MTNAPQSKPRLDWMDGLRALLALYVVAYHITKDTTNLSRPVFAYGHYAVAAFLTISGFCLMMPVVKRGSLKAAGGALNFYGRRCWRILPPYFAALLMSVVVMHYAGLDLARHHLWVKNVWSHVFLLQDLSLPWVYTDPYSVNAPMWSVGLEWHVYLLFPLYCLAFVRWGFLRATLGAFALSILYPMFAPGEWLPIPALFPHFYGLFAVGASAAYIVYGQDALSIKTRVALSKLGPWRVTGVAWTVLMLLFLTPGSHAEDVAWYDTFAAICSALLLIAATLAPSHFVVRALSLRPLVAVGAASYTIYLVHEPFIEAMRTRTCPDWQIIAVIAVVAAVFHFAFERPFLKPLRKGDLLHRIRRVRKFDADVQGVVLRDTSIVEG